LGPVAIGFAHEQLLTGHCPAIWSLDPSFESAELAKKNGLNPSNFKTFPVFGPSWLGYSPAMEKEAISSGGASFDILHQHSIWLAISRVTRCWHRSFSRPTVVTPHGTLEAYSLGRSWWKKRLALRAYEMENLKRADCLHATAISEAASFRRFGLRNPIAVIPNGVSEEWLSIRGDSDRFRNRFAIKPKSRLLLFLSRLHPKKGLPLLFEAMAKFGSSLSEWLLVIAGFEDESGYQKELERVAANLGITNKIIFVGALFGQDKYDAYSAADLFVLTTYSENYGIVVAEALAAGVPVLTTRGAPWQELEMNRCGWWVDINVDSIQEALADAISRPRQELIEMGARGKDLIEEKYTWPRVTQKTIELYSWLMGRGEQPDFVMKD
jgi:glycosyltransferase involved in cell wall biosynthesis